nr:error-prone DNA polymerase [Panacagrimonas sp.]
MNGEEDASGFAELHCLSPFSFQRAASHAKELFARAKELGYSALAITDECSLAGIVRAHEAARDTGVKLIVGCEAQVEDGPRLVLLVPDKAAYESMSGLISHARRRSEKGGYRLLREDFVRFAQTALAIWIPDARASIEHAAWMRDTFSAGCWIGVQRHHAADDAARLRRLREIGARFCLPCVACNDVRYHVRERRALHDVMTAIRHGLTVAECGYRLMPNAEHHLRSLDELRSIYPQDLLDETRRIADRCTFLMTEVKYQYPRELVPDGTTPIGWLRELTARGIQDRWPDGNLKPHVRVQIDKELALIEELQYEAFFLTVHDIVREARRRQILCQGRGSAANSAVCYALGITSVQPDEGNMLFERFVSRERNEPPDIDVDFEHQRREEIIQYVFDKYGRDRAAIAATVIHYRKKMALRDVGKALGAAPDQIDAFTKSLAWWDRPDELPMRMREFGLDPENPLVHRWLTLTEALRGMPRHLSQHVGGFVISDTPVWRLVPMENAAMKDRTIIQWDKDDLESLGLLKVDVLALGMLSALRRMFDLLHPYPDAPRALHEVERDDKDTYDMICRGQTVGVFQIESRAQMSMLPRLRPRQFYDLVIQIAIVRPGPIQGGMVHPYLKWRQARAKDPNFRIDVPARLEKALGRTFGVPLFQEQVMQIAIDGADFTPGEADQVRRSMAAWKRNGGLEHFREKLLTGMARNGFDASFAENIYNMLLGFGSYGFPESHAASFAILAYASAWLKCHEPAAFAAGLINSQPMGFYAPAQLVQDARRNNVRVHPIDVTASDWDCTLEDRNTLRLGLRVVAGLSQDSARRIETARRQQPFADLDDLVHRAQLDARDRRLLADADALRSLSGHRHAARWAALGAERLPGMLSGHAAKEPQLDLLQAPKEGREILDDYASTGLTLRRHPVALLRPRLDAIHVRRAVDVDRIADGRRILVAGLVINRQRPQTANGTVFMTLEDETGSHNLIVWDSVMESQRIVALRASFLIVSGELQKQQGVTHIVARRFHDRSHWLGGLPTVSRDFH